MSLFTIFFRGCFIESGADEIPVMPKSDDITKRNKVDLAEEIPVMPISLCSVPPNIFFFCEMVLSSMVSDLCIIS